MFRNKKSCLKFTFEAAFLFFNGAAARLDMAYPKSKDRFAKHEDRTLEERKS